MPIPCKLSMDAGTLLVVSTGAASVLVQGTNSSSKPIRFNRILISSNNPGSGQQPLQINYGWYTTATSTGGSTPAATPVYEGLTGIYTPVTTFRCNTTTLGTTFAQKYTFIWNTANPVDLVEGMPALQDEIPAGKIWALVFPTAATSAVSVAGTIYYEEFG
jgi:hypothetical protein